MAKTAKDYPVTFPYGATSWPYTSSSPHRGEDRSMPLRTPVEVNNTLIGYAGTTGFSTGVHTHTQKVENYQVVNPKGGGFDVPEPTVVYDVGYDGDSVGNYVRFVDGDGVDWSIFHLDEITVEINEKLGKSMYPTEEDVNYFFDTYLRYAPTQRQIELYTGRPWQELMNNVCGTLRNSLEDQSYKVSQAGEKIANRDKEIEALEEELNNSSYQPIKETLYRKDSI